MWQNILMLLLFVLTFRFCVGFKECSNRISFMFNLKENNAYKSHYEFSVETKDKFHKNFFYSLIGWWLAHNRDNFYKTLYNIIRRRYTNFVLHQDENIIVVGVPYSILTEYD